MKNHYNIVCGGRVLTENVAKCGADCNICPWSKSVQDTMTKEQYIEYCVGCKQTLGYAPAGPYQNCAGCQTPEEEWPEGAKIPLRNCSFRLCVMRTEAETCAHCSRFPCAYIGDRANEWSRENIEKKYNKKVPDENYNTYILPFERYDRLIKVHSQLTPDEIVDVNTVPPINSKIVKFPDNLEKSNEDITSLKKIHQLLIKISESTFDMKDIDVYAQQERLKRRIKHLKRFLWIIGNFAEKDEESESLIIDAKSYVKNRRSESSLGDHSFFVNFVIKNFQELGIIIEPIPLTDVMKGKKGWLTPTGALRDRNWQMRISSSEEIGCIKTLRALQKFCKKLEERYGKKSFGYFTKADMRVLQT
ncbi:MAG: DUF3795 domain-containing protein [Asgard group archaeon]|nr:DUF3795 domain-containing protein [Asgard group archaeon]